MIAFVDGVGALDAAGVTGTGQQRRQRPKRPSQASFSAPASQSSLAPALHDPGSNSFQTHVNPAVRQGSSLPQSKAWAVGSEEHNCGKAQARDKVRPRLGIEEGARSDKEQTSCQPCLSFCSCASLCASHEITTSKIFSLGPVCRRHKLC